MKSQTCDATYDTSRLLVDLCVGKVHLGMRLHELLQHFLLLEFVRRRLALQLQSVNYRGTELA